MSTSTKRADARRQRTRREDTSWFPQTASRAGTCWRFRPRASRWATAMSPWRRRPSASTSSRPSSTRSSPRRSRSWSWRPVSAAAATPKVRCGGRRAAISCSARSAKTAASNTRRARAPPSPRSRPTAPTASPAIPQGRLVACEGLTRRVTREEADGSITVIANNYQGQRINKPNDVVVKSDGSIYFTDPWNIPELPQHWDLAYQRRLSGSRPTSAPSTSWSTT